MQSVKFDTQTPGEKKMHSQKSSSCQGYLMKHCLECEIYLQNDKKCLKKFKLEFIIFIVIFVNLCIRFPKLKVLMMLHGRVEIQNFSSSVKNYFTGESSKPVKSFLTQEEKFCISKWSCNVLLIIETPMKYKTISLTYIFSCCTRCNLLCSHSNSALFIVKITCYFVACVQTITKL